VVSNPHAHFIAAGVAELRELRARTRDRHEIDRIACFLTREAAPPRAVRGHPTCSAPPLTVPSFGSASRTGERAGTRTATDNHLDAESVGDAEHVSVAHLLDVPAAHDAAPVSSRLVRLARAMGWKLVV
jgi:hypothetical protein